MPGLAPCDAQDVDLFRVVVHGVEHDVGIADDRQLSDAGHNARPGTVREIGKTLDAAPDRNSHALSCQPIASVDVGEYLVEL